MTNVSFTVLLSTFAVHHSTVASLVTWPCLDQSDLPGVADGFLLFFCQSTPFHAAAAAGRHALRSCNTFSRFMTSAHAAAASTRAASWSQRVSDLRFMCLSVDVLEPMLCLFHISATRRTRHIMNHRAFRVDPRL